MSYLIAEEIILDQEALRLNAEIEAVEVKAKLLQIQVLGVEAARQVIARAKQKVAQGQQATEPAGTARGDTAPGQPLATLGTEGPWSVGGR